MWRPKVIKVWHRWDPRFSNRPPRAVVEHVRKWAVEVVPDLFEPGHERMAEVVLASIGKLLTHGNGRFVIRTAHPGRAVKWFRKIADAGPFGRSDIGSKVVLAVYAETQEQFDRRIADLRVPRTFPEDLVDVDPEAAIGLAMEDGLISEGYGQEKAREALARGSKELEKHLKEVASYGRVRNSGLCVDKVALFLSPRSPVNIDDTLHGIKAARERFANEHGGIYSFCNESGWHAPPEQFDWVICAGRIGPISSRGPTIGPEPDFPHPVHPNWIADAMLAAKRAGVPFCVPYLGEWNCYNHMAWNGDALVSSGMSSCDRLDIEELAHETVDYDETWAWGERGWGSETPHVKPGSAYMEAAGSHVVGRALFGRIFDEWPSDWRR
jgi:hypothetical protein